MASPRAPQFIQIHHGEHETSPHLTSLRTDAFIAPEIQRLDDEELDIFSHQDIGVNLLEKQPGFFKKWESKLEEFKAAQEQKRAATDAAKKEKLSEPLPALVQPAKKQKKRTQQRKVSAPLRIRNGKAALAFGVIALLLVTPLKALTTYQQIGEAQSSVEDIKTAADASSADIEHAGELVTTALRSFHEANASLSNIDGVEEFILLHTPVFGEKFGAASRLVAAGEHTSLAAASYMQLFRTLKQKSDAPLIERLSLFFEGNKAVVSELHTAAELVRPIDPSALSEESRPMVAQARDAILALDSDAEYLSSAGPIILSMLGDVTPRRYLVVFQNPTELRPTGGFIGSFALIDVANGEIKNMQIPAGGSYDLQGGLKKYLRSPLPLNIINPRWQFQDGNWFPDFPTSAQKLEWFLEKSQGPSVDGVIAINATLLPKLLSVVGPVAIGDGSINLTAENALVTVRDSIDFAAGAESNKPKQIIANAAPAVIETLRAGKPEHFLPIITTLLEALESREVQFYANDPALQKQIAAFGWDGGIRNNPNGDFLSVIATNIGGQKTDAAITQTIDHQAKISDDGTVTVTVRIARQQQHSGKELEGGPNVSYMRYYVPEGSTLIAAKGFTFPSESLFRAPDPWDEQDADLQSVETEVGVDPASGTRITKEFGHTVYGNWMITEPGSKAESVITYTLPHKITRVEPQGLEKMAAFITDPTPATSYSFLMQRQSGAPPTKVTSRVLFPDSWSLGWVTDTRAQVAQNGIFLSDDLTTDIHYAVTAYAPNNQNAN